MTTTRKDGALERAARLLDVLAEKMPVARDATELRIRAVDGWPSGGDGLRRGQSALTPTEAAVERKLSYRRSQDALEAQVRDLTRTASRALRDAERIIGKREADTVTPRCDGGVGREGQPEWGDLKCTEVPETDRRMCAKHRKAMNRWRSEQRKAAQDVEPAHA